MRRVTKPFALSFKDTPKKFTTMYAEIHIGGWKLSRNLPSKDLEKELQALANQYGEAALAELHGNDTKTLSYILPEDTPAESLCTIIGRNSQQCVADTPQRAKELYMSLYSPDKYHQCPKTGAYVFKYVFDLYNAGNESGTITAWKIEHPQQEKPKKAEGKGEGVVMEKRMI